LLHRDERNPRRARRLSVGAIRDPKGQGMRERRLCFCPREPMECERRGVRRTRRNRAMEIAGNYGLLVLLI